MNDDEIKIIPGPAKLIEPPALPNAVNYENNHVANDWWCVVYPATDLHQALAIKLSKQKSGQLIPLTPDEMALLAEFQVWPNQQPLASF